MIGQPFLPTNKTKFLLARTDNRIAARSPLNCLLAVRTGFIVKHFDKLSRIFSNFPPVVLIIAERGPMCLITAPRTNKTATGVALNNCKHFVNIEHSLTIFSWLPLADLHEIVECGIRSTQDRIESFLNFWIILTQTKQHGGRYFYLAPIVDARRKRIIVVGFKALFYMAQPAILTEFLTADVLYDFSISLTA